MENNRENLENLRAWMDTVKPDTSINSIIDTESFGDDVRTVLMQKVMDVASEVMSSPAEA